jgi:hypothetical protein
MKPDSSVGIATGLEASQPVNGAVIQAMRQSASLMKCPQRLWGCIHTPIQRVTASLIGASKERRSMVTPSLESCGSTPPLLLCLHGTRRVKFTFHIRWACLHCGCLNRSIQRHLLGSAHHRSDKSEHNFGFCPSNSSA